MKMICRKVSPECEKCHPYCPHLKPHDRKEDCKGDTCYFKLREEGRGYLKIDGVACIHYKDENIPEELFEL